ncbi:MAG: SAM dependent methyltransferase [Candidatus Berkelbacteria bacterium Licking1014_7]|uniref:SAM dependent methyltransferase n=1 Tax=Candidatus Berkelbacteria bacterium Licking1014_7 TaxID=2017147 RepID=A0A554LJK8_9BACT|nr:MAG: SAM dependent methyltransferase [Candidatus Berkelbacteria bacterium Licking1014_7]
MNIFLKLIKVAIIKSALLTVAIKWQLLGVIKKDIKVKTRSGWLWVNTKDLGFSRDLWMLKGVREPFLTKRLEQEIKSGDTVIDIGANLGYYVLQEAKLVGQTGTIYAIEPVKENFLFLQKNINYNKLNNVRSFQLALGDKNKNGEINISQKRNWSNVKQNLSKDFKLIKKQSVRMRALDSFIKGKKMPDIIRMDVEGYEIEIIHGMERILKQKKLKIVIETHPHLVTNNARRQMFKTLRSNGFKIKWVAIEPNPEQVYLNKSIFYGKILNLFSSWRKYISDFDRSIISPTHKNVASSKRGLHILFEKNHNQICH